MTKCHIEREVVDTPQSERLIDNLIWACGGMVDTLVLGTSAYAWEFESLHAQTFYNSIKDLFYDNFLFLQIKRL